MDWKPGCLHVIAEARFTQSPLYWHKLVPVTRYEPLSFLSRAGALIFGDSWNSSEPGSGVIRFREILAALPIAIINHPAAPIVISLPEAHLHPSAVHGLLQMLRGYAAQNNVAIVLPTFSPEVMEAVDIHHVYLWTSGEYRRITDIFREEVLLGRGRLRELYYQEKLEF
jgi:hypothetical protein